jgi:hypothetical protein
MNRRFWTIAAVSCALASVAWVVRLAGSSRAPDLTGAWKSWRSELEISRKAELFTIEVSNPDGLLGGEYRGKLHGDAIHVTGPLAPLCPEMKYVSDTRKLEFCGEEFARVRDAASPTSKAQADAQ